MLLFATSDLQFCQFARAQNIDYLRVIYCTVAEYIIGLTTRAPNSECDLREGQKRRTMLWLKNRRRRRIFHSFFFPFNREFQTRGHKGSWIAESSNANHATIQDAIFSISSHPHRAAALPKEILTGF
jgi:hypothetical protein